MSTSEKKSTSKVVPFEEVLVLSSEPRQINRLELFLIKINKKLRLGESKFHKLLVATTEAVNNSMIHGNKRDPEKKVILTLQKKQDKLIIKVEDEGTGVNQKNLPNPLAKENLLRENGRGVFLMRTLMDEVSFKKVRKKSAVIMVMKTK